MTPKYTQEEIDQFVKGELDEIETAAFEKELLQNQNLQSEVAETQLLKSTLEGLAQRSFVKKLRNFHQTKAEQGTFLQADDLDEFIMGRADESTQQKIKNRMAQDATFKAAYEEQLKLKKSLEIIEKNRVRHLIKEVGSKATVTKSTERPTALKVSYRRILSIAAAIALIGFGIWWILPPTSVAEQLYAENFAAPSSQGAYPDLDRESFNKPQIHEDLNAADTAYQQGDYVGAVSYFENYFSNADSSDPFYEKATLYFAISLMESGAHPEAATILSRAYNAKPTPEIGWYLALTYLQLNQANKIPNLLETMPAGSYKNDLQQLMDDLPN